jgi:hypothetical protein
MKLGSVVVCVVAALVCGLLKVAEAGGEGTEVSRVPSLLEGLSMKMVDVGSFLAIALDGGRCLDWNDILFGRRSDLGGIVGNVKDMVSRRLGWFSNPVSSAQTLADTDSNQGFPNETVKMAPKQSDTNASVESRSPDSVVQRAVAFPGKAYNLLTENVRSKMATASKLFKPFH